MLRLVVCCLVTRHPVVFEVMYILSQNNTPSDKKSNKSLHFG